MEDNKDMQNKHIPRVSIGMPVYNGALFIREALDSLLSQTFTDFELILSDNASADGTEAICREYSAKDERIRYVRQPEHFGAIHNFQFVLDEAVGEYFMWVAADDVFYKNHLASLLLVHRDSNFTLVASRPDHMEIRSGRYFQMNAITPSLFGGSVRQNFLNFMGLHHWDFSKACMIYGLYRRKEMNSLTFLEDTKAMQDVGSDLLYLYKTIASGQIAYVGETTWRRGERFYRDPSNNKNNAWFLSKALLRRAIFHVINLYPKIDMTGRFMAIEEYINALSKIYSTAFGGIDDEFMLALRDNKKQIISILMPLKFWESVS